MENKPYIVYVKTNESGYITAVNSSAFLEDVTGWTEIDSGYGDKYHHAQGNYFPNGIMADGCSFRYKLAEGKVVECTQKEVDQMVANIHEEPTQLDRIEAQVTYTAMMTDTLLGV